MVVIQSSHHSSSSRQASNKIRLHTYSRIPPCMHPHTHTPTKLVWSVIPPPRLSHLCDCLSVTYIFRQDLLAWKKQPSLPKLYTEDQKLHYVNMKRLQISHSPLFPSPSSSSSCFPFLLPCPSLLSILCSSLIMSHKYDRSRCLAKKNITLDSGSLGTSHLSRLHRVPDLRACVFLYTLRLLSRLYGKRHMHIFIRKLKCESALLKL